MLIPNKFNGYQSDGRRTYPAGGGVGEAMLLGAAMGGGSSAIMGGRPKDILKGALLGGVTGAVGGGISNALPGAQQAAGVVEKGATATLGDALQSQVLDPSIVKGPAAGFANTANEMAGLEALQNVGRTSAAPGGTFTEGMQRFISNPLTSIKDSPYIAGAAGLAGAMGAQRKPDIPEKRSSVLEQYRFDPRRFNPRQMYLAQGGIASLAAGGYDRMVGEQPQYARQMARGGISSLGTYSDGGRMLRGPGDGMSDSIPGVIAGKRPARLADGEFVIPADVVSHLGNGSTDAGARQLYAMMDKVRRARTGRKKQGRQINPRKFMPA